MADIGSIMQMRAADALAGGLAKGIQAGQELEERRTYHEAQLENQRSATAIAQQNLGLSMERLEEERKRTSLAIKKDAQEQAVKVRNQQAWDAATKASANAFHKVDPATNNVVMKSHDEAANALSAIWLSPGLPMEVATKGLESSRKALDLVYPADYGFEFKEGTLFKTNKRTGAVTPLSVPGISTLSIEDQGRIVKTLTDMREKSSGLTLEALQGLEQQVKSGAITEEQALQQRKDWYQQYVDLTQPIIDAAKGEKRKTIEALRDTIGQQSMRRGTMIPLIDKSAPAPYYKNAADSSGMPLKDELGNPVYIVKNLKPSELIGYPDMKPMTSDVKRAWEIQQESKVQPLLRADVMKYREKFAATEGYKSWVDSRQYTDMALGAWDRAQDRIKNGQDPQYALLSTTLVNALFHGFIDRKSTVRYFESVGIQNAASLVDRVMVQVQKVQEGGTLTPNLMEGIVDLMKTLQNKTDNMLGREVDFVMRMIGTTDRNHPAIKQLLLEDELGAFGRYRTSQKLDKYKKGR